MKKVFTLLGLGLTGGTVVATAVFLALPALLGQSGGLWEAMETIVRCESASGEMTQRCHRARDLILAKQDITNDLLEEKATLAETMVRFRRVLELEGDGTSSVVEEEVFQRVVFWVSATLVEDQPRLEKTLRTLKQERTRMVARSRGERSA